MAQLKRDMLKLAYWCFLLALATGLVAWIGVFAAVEEWLQALSAVAWSSFGLFLINGLRRRP